MIADLLLYGFLFLKFKKAQTTHLSPLMKLILGLVFLAIAIGLAVIFTGEANNKIDGFPGLVGRMS